jgi:4-hydroxybenzoate polyprenyltransferase
MMPILSGDPLPLDDAGVLLLLLVLLLVLLLLLLLPQAAIQSPPSAQTATTLSERGKRCMIPNLVTSSVTFSIAQLP